MIIPKTETYKLYYVKISKTKNIPALERAGRNLVNTINFASCPIDEG